MYVRMCAVNVMVRVVAVLIIELIVNADNAAWLAYCPRGARHYAPFWLQRLALALPFPATLFTSILFRATRLNCALNLAPGGTGFMIT